MRPEKVLATTATAFRIDGLCMSKECCLEDAEVDLPALLRKCKVDTDGGRCNLTVVRIVVICEAHVRIGKLPNMQVALTRQETRRVSATSRDITRLEVAALFVQRTCIQYFCQEVQARLATVTVSHLNSSTLLGVVPIRVSIEKTSSWDYKVRFSS